MAFFSIKRKPTDVVFSKIVRIRAKWKCERCGKDCSQNKGMLHCSHYYGRSREATRYELDNCVAFCFHCHQELGHGDATGHEEYKKFMINRIGPERFDSLFIQSESYKKKDDKETLIALNEIYKREDDKFNGRI